MLVPLPTALSTPRVLSTSTGSSHVHLPARDSNRTPLPANPWLVVTGRGSDVTQELMCLIMEGVRNMMFLGNLRAPVFLPPITPPPQQKQMFCFECWRFVVSEGLESTRKNHTTRTGEVSNYLATKNVRKPTNIISWFVALITRLWFVLLNPEAPDPMFCKIPCVWK